MSTFISYQTGSRVLENWELARQKYGSEAAFGSEILFQLFRLAPGAKVVFGFQIDDNVETQPLLRASALAHGTRIVQMLDGVLTMIGPSMEMLEDILSQLGDRHVRHGVRKEYIPLVGDAVRHAVAKVALTKYTSQDDDAFKVVFDLLSAEIIKSMH